MEATEVGPLAQLGMRAESRVGESGKYRYMFISDYTFSSRGRGYLAESSRTQSLASLKQAFL
jgi:hypothetical protein